ncbi:MAG: YciI family protein [Neisseriaceae bacterium]|nr:YciI family protein [Neisseriaceae bacterium]
MLYVISAVDAPNTLAQRLANRPEHLVRLEALQAEGKLVLAGAHPAIDNEQPGDAGFTGSTIIAEFPDLAAAEAWAQADPFVAAGVYQTVTVKPLRRAF